MYQETINQNLAASKRLVEVTQSPKSSGVHKVERSQPSKNTTEKVSIVHESMSGQYDFPLSSNSCTQIMSMITKNKESKPPSQTESHQDLLKKKLSQTELIQEDQLHP